MGLGSTWPSSRLWSKGVDEMVLCGCEEVAGSDGGATIQDAGALFGNDEVDVLENRLFNCEVGAVEWSL